MTPRVAVDLVDEVSDLSVGIGEFLVDGQVNYFLFDLSGLEKPATTQTRCPRAAQPFVRRQP